MLVYDGNFDKSIASLRSYLHLYQHKWRSVFLAK